MNLEELSNDLQKIKSAKKLKNYLSSHFILIQSAFYRMGYEELFEKKFIIQDLFIDIEERGLISIDELDDSIQAFIILFGDFFERLCFTSEIIEITKYLPECSTKKRLQAAKLFLRVNDINTDYISNFHPILKLLSEAYFEEESPFKITITLINYFLTACKQLSRIKKFDILKELSGLFKNPENITNYPFLGEDIISQTISIDLKDLENEVNRIQIEVWKFELEKLRIVVPKISLVEEKSDYSESIKMIIKPNFEDIRALSVKYVNQITYEIKNQLFYQLGHGVDIIDKVDLLYMYIYAFGNMHQYKLIEAFETFLNDSFSREKIDIIDWGCGQALASIVLLDFMRQHRIKPIIHNLFLIEPSELAIKRGLVHIGTIKKDFRFTIIPIISDIDSLDLKDFTTSESNLKMHLFSNIIDLPKFNLLRLAESISQTQPGLNYFICVSPYIDAHRNQRLNVFYNYFQENSETKIISQRINFKNVQKWRCKDNYCDECFDELNCNKNWTRHELIFSSSL